MDNIHLIVRVTGEYSDREVTIVGAYSGISVEKAQALVEELKASDRAAYVVNTLWHREFNKRRKERGMEDHVNQVWSQVARDLGMDPEPDDYGSEDSEYTVVSISLNEAGEWRGRHEL